MAKAPKGSRHLKWADFEARIQSAIPSVESLEGSPAVHLIIEPGARRIGARFYSQEKFRIPSPLEEVTIRQVGVGTQTALEISTGNETLFREFYALSCLIADRVQLERQPISKAVTDTLAAWAALISKKNLLDDHRQVGLIGELIFLSKAAAKLGWTIAAHSWFGLESEEHDFVLPRADVEVKTTTSERRIHEIGSLTQLLPKSGRPLYLASVQLTSGGNSRESFSLPEILAKVLTGAEKSSPDGADQIRQQLRRSKWSDEDAAYYAKRYSLRTPIQVAEVGEGFPALVPSAIAHLGEGGASRFERVSYAINVDGLGFPDGSKEFDRLFRAGANE